MSHGSIGRATIGCREALRLLAAYLDGELEGHEQFDVHRHLQTCRSCYSRAEFEQRLKRQLGALRGRAAMPEFEDRIRELIRQFQGVAEERADPES